jgi:hypothetical protein
MAKRQETTDIFGGKLSGIGTFGATPGQEPPPASKAGRFYRKTYLLTQEIIERVKATANQNRVGHSEFVRWALTTIMDELEDGSREIPVTVEEKRVISG